MTVSGARLFPDYLTFMFVVDDLRKFQLAIALFRLLANIVNAKN